MNEKPYYFNKSFPIEVVRFMKDNELYDMLRKAFRKKPTSSGALHRFIHNQTLEIRDNINFNPYNPIELNYFIKNCKQKFITSDLTTNKRLFLICISIRMLRCLGCGRESIAYPLRKNRFLV